MRSLGQQIIDLVRAAKPVGATRFSARQYVEIPHHDRFDLGGDFTIEAFVRRGTEPGLQRVAAKTDQRSGAGWVLSVSPIGPTFQLSFREPDDPASSRTIQVSAVPRPEVHFRPNTWHHFACAYRRGLGVTLCFDRIPMQHTTEAEARSVGDLIGCTDPLLVGNYLPESGGDFDIAQLRIWNRALDPAELWLASLRALSGDEASLVACWPFEGPLDQTVPDIGRYGHDGMVRNGPLAAAPEPTPTFAPACADPPTAEEELEYWRGQATEARDEQRRGTDDLRASRIAFEDVVEECFKLQDEERDARQQQAAVREEYRVAMEMQRAKFEAERNDRLAGDGIKIASVVGSLNAQIQQSRAELRRRGAPYRLTNVSIEMRVAPDGAGAGVIFPTSDELGTDAAARLSTLRAEFTSIESTETPDSANVTVPDLIGYTRGLAERRLAALGLKMHVQFEAVTTGPQASDEWRARIDRILAQSPNPGDKINAAGTVTVRVGQQATQAPGPLPSSHDV